MGRAPQIPATFIVRIARDPQGGISGVVERATTGAKERFEGCDAIGQVIASMLSAEPEDERGDAHA